MAATKVMLRTNHERTQVVRNAAHNEAEENAPGKADERTNLQNYKVQEKYLPLHSHRTRLSRR